LIRDKREFIQMVSTSQKQSAIKSQQDAANNNGETPTSSSSRIKNIITSRACYNK